jgi:hypothetical protein
MPLRESNAPIDRSELTKHILKTLRDNVADVLFGRGIAHPDGGWPKGNAESGAWVDYAVLKTGTAITPAPGAPDGVGRPRVTWLLNYALTSHAESDSLVDDLANKSRSQIHRLFGPVTLDSIEWEVDQVLVPRLGATERDDSTDPAHWRVTDDITVRLARVSRR